MLFRPNNNNRGVRTAPSCRALRVSYRPLTKFNRETLYEMNRSGPIQCGSSRQNTVSRTLPSPRHAGS